MIEVFREVRRVLRPDGTLWLNLGDSYAGARGGGQGVNGCMADRAVALNGIRERCEDRLAPGLKPKDLVGIPWRVAFVLQADGWWLRSDIIWAKPNPMPESVTDRPTKAHEYLFLLAKSERYFYGADAIREPHTSIPDGVENDPEGWKSGPATEREGRPGVLDSLGVANRPKNYFGHALGRNRRSVWTISTKPFAGAHFAVMPWDLVEPCVLAGSREGDVVLDPFAGAGTVGMVARRHGRRFVGVEINPTYAAMARERISGDMPLLNGGAVPAMEREGT
jgi:DNA modification methylase